MHAWFTANKIDDVSRYHKERYNAQVHEARSTYLSSRSILALFLLTLA